MTTPKREIDPASVGPVKKKLDPTILAAAARAHPGAVTAKRTVLAAEALVEANQQMQEELARTAGTLQRRDVVVINARTSARSKSKVTPAVQKTYLDLLRQAVTPPHAAKACGVSTLAIKAAMRADPDFAEAVLSARSDATSPIVEAMWELALSGSFAAQKYLLENMAPEDWKDPKSIRVEVSGQIESVGPEDRAGQIERIQRLEERLAERLALRAAGDEIEALELESGQIEDADLVDDSGQID